MTQKDTLRIAVFLDGRAGHEKQTLGIVKALERDYTLEIKEIAVSRPSLGSYLCCLTSYMLGKVSTKRFPHLAGYDLLIGTGTHTHLPMLSCKKAYNIPAVTCMSPAWYLASHFDLIFSPFHDGFPEAYNRIVTTGPPNTNVAGRAHHDNRVLILVGGVDKRRHIWSSKQIVADIKRLCEDNTDKYFTISSSPRTPEETCKVLEKLSTANEHVRFCHFKDTPAGWVEEQYQVNKEVWVTGDSISMVYEALSSGCAVGVIPVRWRRRGRKFRVSEEYLQKQGLIVDLYSYCNGKKLQQKEPILDEAARCAEEIRRQILCRN